MSKFCFLVAGIIPALTSAQITITQSDLPQVGETWGYSNFIWDTLFASTPGGPSEQIWDYTDLFNVPIAHIWQWMVPSSLDGNMLFPEATQGLQQGPVSQFFVANSSGLYQVGSHYPSNGSTYTDHRMNQLELPVPFTYGSERTFAETTTGINVSDDSPAVMDITHTGGTYVCDAWGTLHSPSYPLGTSVLRLAFLQSDIIDSSFVDSTGTGYGPWTLTDVNISPGYANFHLFVRNGAPVMVAQVNSGGAAMYYSHSLPDGISSNDLDQQAPSAYPVPSTGVVHIAFGKSDAHSLEILNALGAVQRRMSVQGVDEVNVGTDAMVPGTYVFRCIGADGGIVGQGRFIVVR